MSIHSHLQRTFLPAVLAFTTLTVASVDAQMADERVLDKKAAVAASADASISTELRGSLKAILGKIPADSRARMKAGGDLSEKEAGMRKKLVALKKAIARAEQLETKLESALGTLPASAQAAWRGEAKFDWQSLGDEHIATLKAAKKIKAELAGMSPSRKGKPAKKQAKREPLKWDEIWSKEKMKKQKQKKLEAKAKG